MNAPRSREVYTRHGSRPPRRFADFVGGPIRGRSNPSSDFDALLRSSSTPSDNEKFTTASLGSLSARLANKSPEKSPERKVAESAPSKVSGKVEKAKGNAGRQLPLKKSQSELAVLISTLPVPTTSRSQPAVSSEPPEPLSSNPYDFDADEVPKKNTQGKADSKKTNRSASPVDWVTLPPTLPAVSSQRSKPAVAYSCDFDIAEMLKKNAKRKGVAKKAERTVSPDAFLSKVPAAFSRSTKPTVSSSQGLDAEDIPKKNAKSRAATSKKIERSASPDNWIAPLPKLPSSAPSTSSSQPVALPAPVNPPVSNPYDFDAESSDEEEKIKPKSQSSSGGSTSSQGSNGSTGSDKAWSRTPPLTKSKTSVGSRVFKRPAVPGLKPTRGSKAVRPKAKQTNTQNKKDFYEPLPPVLAKAESFPPTPVKLPSKLPPVPVFKEPSKKVQRPPPEKKVAFIEPKIPPIPEKKPATYVRARTSVGKRSFEKTNPDTETPSGSPPKTLKVEEGPNSSQPVIPEYKAKDISQKTEQTAVVKLDDFAIPVAKKPVAAFDDSFLQKKSEDIEMELMQLIKGLGPQHPMPVRCLNAIKLALKLINPGTMMHFFACEYREKLFDYFKDAASNENLSLAVAAVVLVQSTDSLKINLDRKGLNILKEILEKSSKQKQPDKNVVDGVWSVLERLTQYRRGRDVAKTDMTASRLVIEAIVIMKLGSQLRWFIDEIRRQGILEYCIAHLEMLLPRLEKDPTMADLKAVDRLTEFFYKVMHENRENSLYLCTHKGASGASGFELIVRLIKVCVSRLDKKNKNPPGVNAVVGTILRAIFSNLINVIAHAELWRQELGHLPDFIPLLIQTSISGFTDVIPREKSQEIVLRSLLCLVNLTYNCEENCQVVVKVLPVVPGKDNLLSLAQLIKSTSVAAEASGDDMERVVEQYGKMIRSIDLNLDVTITDVLDKAGDNMEHYAIMSYTGILLSHLISQNDDAHSILKTHLETAFGSVSEGITVAAEAIRRMTEFIADAKAERIHPLHELNAAVDALESYGYSCGG
ncbi:hypothetical protein RvY_16171 [Ramazzottius varieornatus]|uniref:WAPL domain-containing protein n=1 Tax=Ramazzottius varieornatus TaxID=947166 RepID=A0A1D1VXI6_RAMVA|nr:hypothetical protein RvY_16171 [Ramazzottius varieornatus]